MPACAPCMPAHYACLPARHACLPARHACPSAMHARAPCMPARVQDGVINSCLENSVRQLAQEGARKQMDAAALAEYEFVQYIMPKGADEFCE